MEPDSGFPQAASAHDTFWDFASLIPESMHMLVWVMSDRAIPRSLRMIEGFELSLIGSSRRECTDHIIAVGDGHLRRVPRSYAHYYKEPRTHRSLNKDA